MQQALVTRSRRQHGDKQAANCCALAAAIVGVAPWSAGSRGCCRLSALPVCTRWFLPAQAAAVWDRRDAVFSTLSWTCETSYVASNSQPSPLGGVHSGPAHLCAVFLALPLPALPCSSAGADSESFASTGSSSSAATSSGSSAATGSARSVLAALRLRLLPANATATPSAAGRGAGSASLEDPDS